MSIKETAMAKGKPTEKQVKYFAEKMKGVPTKKQAALNAGYSLQTAENVEAQIESRVGYKSLAEMLNTPEIKARMQEVLKEGLDAKKVIVIDNVMEEVTDYAERRQYTRTIAEITGDMAEKKIDLTSKGQRINYSFQEVLPEDEQDNTAHDSTDEDTEE